MATFTATISNTMVIIGPGEPNLWNTLVWGTNNWGSDNDMRTVVFKNLASESISQSDVFAKMPVIVLGVGTMALTSTAATFCHFDGFLQFKYVRAGDDGDDGFSKTADGSSGWSKTADGSDNWS
jgi:hypothetical protein